MKAINYVCCAFVLACLLNAVRSEKAQSKIEQQFMDAFTAEESMKMKRPFCNAFTGCGRKRSFNENPGNFQDPETGGIIRLPLTLYKALLKAASQNIRSIIDRDVNQYKFSGIPQVYFPEKTPLRKRSNTPPTFLN